MKSIDDMEKEKAEKKKEELDRIKQGIQIYQSDDIIIKFKMGMYCEMARLYAYQLSRMNKEERNHIMDKCDNLTTFLFHGLDYPRHNASPDYVVSYGNNIDHAVVLMKEANEFVMCTVRPVNPDLLLELEYMIDSIKGELDNMCYYYGDEPYGYKWTCPSCGGHAYAYDSETLSKTCRRCDYEHQVGEEDH